MTGDLARDHPVLEWAKVVEDQGQSARIFAYNVQGGVMFVQKSGPQLSMTANLLVLEDGKECNASGMGEWHLLNSL